MTESGKATQDKISVALERFNKEFTRMESNFNRLYVQLNTVSQFINNQKRLFRK